MSTASIFADFWNDQILAEEKQGLFLVLIGFLLSFGFIRMSTRLMRSPRVPWWPGSVVSESGVHVHHLVFGIVTMMAAGAVGFTVLGDSPYAEICAFLFGVGAGLTIDEFALWVYLEDVYWSEQGRVSIDATVIAAAAMGLILLGYTPFSFDTGSLDEVLISIAGALIVFGTVAVCFAKQRFMHGAVGFFVLPVAIYGALRLGKPGSPWGRRRYREGRRALPVGPSQRALQGSLPRRGRRQAERGDRRSAPARRRRGPAYSPIALMTSRFGRRPSNSQ
jgi:hypothetical protein